MDKTKHKEDGGAREAPRHPGSKQTTEENARPAGPSSKRPPDQDRDPEEEGSAGKRQV